MNQINVNCPDVASDLEAPETRSPLDTVVNKATTEVGSPAASNYCH